MKSDKLLKWSFVGLVLCQVIATGICWFGDLKEARLNAKRIARLKEEMENNSQ